MAVKDPGELRHQLTFQRNAGTRDALNEQTDSWVDVAPAVWCKVEPLAGREFWLARQTQSDVTHRITCRFRSGLTAAMRATLGTRVFNFVEPPRDLLERHEWLEVLAKEVGPS